MVNRLTPHPKKGRRQETKAATCNRLFDRWLPKKGTAKGGQDAVNRQTPLPPKKEKTGNKGCSLRSIVGSIACKKRKRNSKGGPRHGQSANSSPPKQGEDRKQRPPLVDRSLDRSRAKKEKGRANGGQDTVNRPTPHPKKREKTGNKGCCLRSII